jgi:hypothetical protein
MVMHTLVPATWEAEAGGTFEPRILKSTYIVRTFVTARQQWLPPVILANQEAEIRRIMVQSQPGT